MRRFRLGDKVLRLRDEPEPSSLRGGPARSVPPLFCIHGAGMSSVVFMDVVRRLPPARRVIAPDLPGHGQSDRWHEAITLERYSDAVRTLFDTLELPRVVLVGHSMGAAIALLCALAWPERVAGLVLLNGAARLDTASETLELLERTLPTGPLGGSEWVDRMPDELADLSFSPETAPELRARWQAVLCCATRDVVLSDFRACRGFDVSAKLGQLTFPTLVVGGSDDLLVPPTLLSESVAKLPRGRIQLLPRSGHLSHLEQPELFLGHLQEFLATVKD